MMDKTAPRFGERTTPSVSVFYTLSLIGYILTSSGTSCKDCLCTTLVPDSVKVHCELEGTHSSETVDRFEEIIYTCLSDRSTHMSFNRQCFGIAFNQNFIVFNGV
jgi:hypothetical protein